MKKEIIGNCELWLGDCRDILPTLGRVDAVITDPPFEVEAHTQQRRTLGRGPAAGRRDIINAALPFSEITAGCRTETGRMMAQISNGWTLVFCQAEAVGIWRDALEHGGAKWRRSMVWIKPDGMPQFSGDRPGMGYESIAAAWCGDGGSHWNGGGRHGVFVIPKHDGGYGHGGTSNSHPTQKPQRLMNELILLFTNDGQTICDPFMGSGTTGVSAAKNGRNFIGVEIEPKYFDISCKRIDEAYKQPDFFIPAPAKVRQEAML